MFLTPGIWWHADTPHQCNAYCRHDVHATVVELHRTSDGPLDDRALRHDIGLHLAGARVIRFEPAAEAHRHVWHDGDVCRSFLVFFES